MTCVVNEQQVCWWTFCCTTYSALLAWKRSARLTRRGWTQPHTGRGKLAKIQVAIPPLAVQQVFVDLQATVSALKFRHAAFREANATLLPATLERLFVNEDRGQ
ncbi:hypothetical protein [Lysobacter sp. Root690]|uniref:restriction endonuclease subunit S n=1 Tax=Lysobacter sp. Root690 TaxID=1736588 RepID=UPI0012FA87C5|nr:hypothetical protein [Lysobacter sp. Root690]